MNKNSDSGLVGLIVFTVCFFAFLYMVDIDKFSKSLDKFWNHFCTSDDPANFVILVVAGFIIGGLLMLIEYRPRN